MDSQSIKNTTQTHQNSAPSTQKFIFSKELNAEFLEQSYSANLEFGKKMFSIFLSTIEEDISILTSSLQANDFTGIKDIAHKIKNNFTWVGLPRLSSVVYKIEMAAMEKSVSVVTHYNELMDIFNSEHKLVQQEYERMVKYLN